MTPETLALFPPVAATLKNGARARIRALAADDGEALAAVYASLPMDSLRFYGPALHGRERALQVAADAGSPSAVVLVLEVDDGLGGYAWYSWKNESDDRSHFGICIGASWQSQGAGTALLTRLLTIAKTVGPPVMSLTVQLANTRAVKLYTRLGFRIVREQLCHRPPDSPWEPEPEYYMELRVR